MWEFYTNDKNVLTAPPELAPRTKQDLEISVQGMKYKGVFAMNDYYAKLELGDTAKIKIKPGKLQVTHIECTVSVSWVK